MVKKTFMKNLRLFGTESQYNIEAPSLEYPTISYITGSDAVKWMKKPGPHDYSEDYLTFKDYNASLAQRLHLEIIFVIDVAILLAIFAAILLNLSLRVGGEKKQ